MFDFKFEFLTPKQNKQLSESMEFLVGLELDRLRSDRDALQKRCADLDMLNAQLVKDKDKICQQFEASRKRLHDTHMELMDSRRANVVLRESLEKERTAERPVPAYEIDKLKSENAIMAGVIEKLKDELRTYKDFAKRIIRVAESVPGGAFEDEKV